MNRLPHKRLALLAAGAWIVAAPGHAYGPAGHRIAGLAAAPALCERARYQTRALTGVSDLGEIGLWADRIRSDPAWERAAPWHYMNIADEASLDAHRHPPEGDVLWAIRHFRDELGDPAASPEARADALRFLIHFVVDIHQPLHVGRASDRGGNTVDVRVDGDTMNLHRFWDSEAIALADRPLGEYAERIAPAARALSRAPLDPPEAWAAESLELRSTVYDLRPGGRLDEDYLATARRITERRLGQAAGRLAATLNSIFCR